MSDIGRIDLSLDMKRAKIEKKQRKLAESAKKKKKPKNKEKRAEQKDKSIPRLGYRKYLRYLPVLYIVIAMFLAVFFRLHYATIPLMDDWAEQSAIATFKSKITEEVEFKYPYYSQEMKDKVVEEELEKALIEYKSLIMEKSDSLRDSFKDPDGHTYLYGIDPYNYFKNAKDKNLEDFLSFFSYYLHKFVTAFDDEATLMQTSFYIPIIFVCLTIIPLFFIARRIADDLTGFIAAVIFAIHPEFLKYSLAGIADTNTLNIFFIMMISWMFIELIYHRSIKQRIMIAIPMLILIELFYLTWSGYYIVLGLIAVYLAVFLGIYLFNRIFRGISPIIRSIIFIIIIIMLFVVSFFGFDFGIGLMPEKVQNFLGFSSQDSIWPDSYSSITELKDVPFQDLIFRLGGGIFSLIVIMSIIYMFREILTSEKIPGPVLFTVISSTIFLTASLKAIRIFPFSVPFMCILLGFGILIILGLIKKSLVAIHIKDKRMISLAYIIFIATLLILMSIPFLKNYQKVSIIKPRMDDSLYNTAIEIRDDSDENAKIFCWWDKGHFFHAISDREVLQKATPAMPRVYWMAKALVTDDEDLSRGIIRMLACNGEKITFATINKKYNTPETIELMDTMISLDRTEAEKYIEKKGISKVVLDLTHCEPETTYIVVTDDMFTRLHTIQKYTFWDFEKSADDQEIYSSLRPYECSKLNNTYTCNAEKYTVVVDSETKKTNLKAGEIIIIDEDIKRISFNQSDSEIKMVIYKRDNRYYTIIGKEHIVDSIYIRLMVEQGSGLDNFELLSDYSRPETMRVASYEVKW